MRGIKQARNGVLVCLITALFLGPVLNLSAQENVETLEERLTEARRILDDRYLVTASDLEELQNLYNDIADAGNSLLLPEARMLLFIAEEQVEGTMAGGSTDAESTGQKVSRLPARPAVPLAVSAVSAGLFNLFWILGDHYHSKYTDAATPLEASTLMPYWQAFDLLTFLSAGTSIVSLGISLPLLVSQPASFTLSQPRGETVQEQVQYLLQQRERALKVLRRSEKGWYTLIPQVLLSTSFTFFVTQTLLFTMGTQVFSWNVPDYHSSSNNSMDPVSLSGMVIGIAASSLLISYVVTAFLNPSPLNLEAKVARGQVELEKRDYDTASFDAADRERLAARQEILLEKLEKGEGTKRWSMPTALAAAGAGITSLTVMGVLMKSREDAEEAIREGSTYDGTIPSDSWIIGTGVAGGVLLSAAGTLLMFTPPVRKIREELAFIGRRLFEEQ